MIDSKGTYALMKCNVGSPPTLREPGSIPQLKRPARLLTIIQFVFIFHVRMDSFLVNQELITSPTLSSGNKSVLVMPRSEPAKDTGECSMHRARGAPDLLYWLADIRPFIIALLSSTPSLLPLHGSRNTRIVHPT